MYTYIYIYTHTEVHIYTFLAFGGRRAAGGLGEPPAEGRQGPSGESEQ